MARALALTFAGAFLGFFAAADGGLPVVPAAIVGGLAGLVGSALRRS